MTLKEFAEQYPELVEKAGECKTREEFAKFVKDKGLELPEEALIEAYSYVRAQADGELSEDAIEGVAGGAKYKSGQWADVTIYVDPKTNNTVSRLK